MHSPIVSVVMPVYNGSKYLKEAIDSILNQTFTDFELIVVNDGSTDDSEKIILSYNDQRIRYLKNKQNSGICTTLNKGLNNANGKYIARMDCDDISMPERLAKQVGYLECHPDIGALGTDIITFGEGRADKYFNFVHNHYECRAGLLFFTCFAHPTVMLRASIINEYDLRYDDEYRGLEDYELWYRMSEYTEMTNLPEALIKYRLHKAQLTQNVTKGVSNKEKEFIRDRFRHYAEFTEEQIGVVENYVLNRWDDFNDKQVYTLLDIFYQILKSKDVNSNKCFRRAMQITLSKAIVYVCNMCKDIKISRMTLYSKILAKGIMPLDWYFKFMFHEIVKR